MGGSLLRRLALVAVLAMGLSGCFTLSDAPVIGPSGAQSDPALIGLWYGSLNEDDDPFFLHFVRPEAKRAEGDDNPDRGAMTAVIIFHGSDDDEESEWGYLDAVASPVDGGDEPLRFLSFQFTFMSDADPEDANDTAEGYHLFLYHIRSDDAGNERLVLKRVSDDYLEEQISSGALSGTVSQGKYTSNARVTATSAELAAHFAGTSESEITEDDAGSFSRLEASGLK